MLDLDEVDYYRKEFSDCLSAEKGFGEPLFRMGNEPLSDELYEGFKAEFPTMKLWKTPMGQFISFGKKSEMQLAGILHDVINEKKKLIAEYEEVLERLPPSLPIPF